ncbi:MAG: DapH/DapD/GlmU-related protein [Lysobacterales bacterium]
MIFGETLRRLVLDPVARKIDSRIAHFRSLECTTHDGRFWNHIAEIEPRCVFYADAAMQNYTKALSRLKIGASCHIRGEILVLASGSFELGHHCFIGSGTRIWCRDRIFIGSHVLISHLVDIHDSDSHSNRWQQRRCESITLFEQGIEGVSGEVASAEVVIEDDVWIGFKSSILKGVRIGRGAIVAAGSVVTKDVQPFTLVAGNPARKVRELEQ